MFLTRTIDAGLDAILTGILRVRPMLDCYQPGTPEHEALAKLIHALEETDQTLLRRDARPSRP